MHFPTFSVITVCYNAQDTIVATIESVLKQNLIDYEYIVVDGKSTDETAALAGEYAEHFAKKGVSYKVVSEKDSGIYNAMNKGAAMANGIWIVYMNAGDVFFSSDVLEKVHQSIKSKDVDIIYGDTIFKYGDLYQYHPCDPLETIFYRMPLCHQSIFTKATLLRKCPYNEEYHISADYDFYLKSFLRGASFQHLEFPISVFALGGISTSGNAFLHQSEVLHIRMSQGIITKSEYENKVKNMSSRKNKVKRVIKMFVPRYIKKRIAYNRYIRAGFSPSIEEAFSKKEQSDAFC